MTQQAQKIQIDTVHGRPVEVSVLGTTPDGVVIVDHDGIHDHQTCPKCGLTTGASVHLDGDDLPHADATPNFWETWLGECPRCGSETGLPLSYYLGDGED